jgi:hypothetical protein
MAERKGSKKLGAGAEAELRAKAMKAKGTSSKGLDLRSEGRNLKTRADRAYLAGISGMGGAALTGAGLIGKAIGHKDGDSDLTRGRGAFKDVGKFAKAAIMGEPKGEKYVDNDGLGKYYMRGSDKDWEKKEAKKSATKKMANGGSTGGKIQTSSDTARKLATEMGGMKDGGAMKPVDEAKNPGLSKLPSEVRNKMGYMKKGGKPKANGLAVMIAIGSPMKGMKKPKEDMKKPVKKMAGGMMYADGGKPVKKMGGGMMYANGGKPDKFAQGGAGKVRKGMMTPEGKIIHAMNKIRGK